MTSGVTQIRAHGLCKMQRHHVHLSADAATAANVGARRGKPLVLRIAAGSMHRAEHSFYLASNGVWLTEHVPASYIEFPSDVSDNPHDEQLERRCAAVLE